VLEQVEFLDRRLPGPPATEVDAAGVAVHFDALEDLHRIEFDVVDVLVPQAVIGCVAHDLGFSHGLELEPLRPADPVSHGLVSLRPLIDKFDGGNTFQLQVWKTHSVWPLMPVSGFGVRQSRDLHQIEPS
jgi:hypothetical protein